MCSEIIRSYKSLIFFILIFGLIMFCINYKNSQKIRIMVITGGHNFEHDVDIPLQIVDKNHPVTKEINDFVIRDEIYGNIKILETVHPLIKTNHPESSECIAWVNRYGNSKIVYLQCGHDHHAYENPNFRKLVKQAIE